MKNNKKSDDMLEELLRAALTSEMEPADEINRRILRSWKESFAMNKQNRKSFKIAVAAAVCVMLTGVTVGATVRYLSAVDVAEETENDEIVAAFRGENAILLNETQECGDYRVTLLGITTGERMIQSDLSDALSLNMDSTYAAVAIEHANGTPMPDSQDDAYGDLRFFVSPLIEGLTPWQYNIAGGISGGYSEFVRNGVLYRMIECDDIMMFADRTLYMCVTDTTFYETMAYHFDETTGEITRNESYEGMNLLFTLPIDPSKADPTAAEEYLKIMEEQWNPADEDDTESDGDDTKSDEDAISADAAAACEQITQMLLQGKKDEALGDAEFRTEETLTLKNNRYEFDYYEDITNEEDEVTVSGATYYFYPADFVDGRHASVCYNFNGTGEVQGFTIMLLEENGDDTATIEVWKKAI